jgi:hypothetical protein
VSVPPNTDQPQISLAYLPPTPQQTRSALAWAAVLLLGLAILAPFAGKPLPRTNGFIPALDATILGFICSGILAFPRPCLPTYGSGIETAQRQPCMRRQRSWLFVASWAY